MPTKLASIAPQSTPQASQEEQTYQLSHGQQALWLLSQQNSSNSAYNVSIPARIVSAVDAAALKQALQGLIDRHATLRTTFITDSDGSPLQVVHGSLPVCFEHVDAAHWRQSELEQAVRDTHQRPFDLAHGPIFRGTLFTRSPQEHILLLSLHHIVYDAWSIGPLLNDLQQLYTAIKANVSPKQSSNGQQYSDYVQWQTQVLAGPEGERLWHYWKNQLAGELPVLDLPTDRPYPKQPSYRGASHRFKLTPAQTQAIKALAQSAGTTTYTVLMAAFQVFLHRYTGQTDILVGTPVGGRPQPEFEQIVGYFVNPVAIRGRLTSDLTFSDVLEQIRTTVLEAIEHHNYPFPRLVERLRPQRDVSRSSIFQVVFNFLQLQKIDPVAALLIADDNPLRLQWADLELESFPLEQQEGQFDLALGMVETQTTLIGTLKYSTDLFNADTIERMASHFQMLLDGIVANPNQTISMLPLLTTDEQHQQLQAWNDTQADYPQDKCIHQLFEEQVEKTPHNVAAIFQDRQLTYSEVNQKANQLAKVLQARGIGRGTYVPVLIDRGVNLLIAHLAVMKTGAAFCPMDPKWPLPRIQEIISALNSNIVLVDATCPHQSNLSEKICLDVNETSLKGTQDNLDISVELDDPIYVIFTSGSTGKPKGAINQHRGIVNRFFNMNDRYGCREDDVILFTSSHVFDSSVWQLFWPLINGSPTVITPPGFGFDLDRIIGLMHEQKVTISDFVPSVFNILVDHLSQHKEDRQKLGSLRQLLIGGEAMNANDIYQFKSFFPTVGITNTYGPTETSIGVVFYEVPPTFINPIPIGRPLNNVYALILDRHLNQVPMGVTGELYIGGQCVGLGYLNDPVKTDAVFVDNPFNEIDSQKLYKTGDLVRYRPDGNIEFLGRADHQVKIRGVRIELKEIESLLAQHSGVKRTIVIPRGDIKNKYLVGYIITEENHSVTAKELRNYLKQKLPIYMMPAGFVFLEMFPLTPNGKIDRRRLPEPESTQLILDNTFIAPRNPTEAKLSQFWGELLNVNRIGIHDNFFELGGHSLLATQVISRLRSHFSIDIPLRSLFDSPTVAELAEDIELLHQIKHNSVSQRNIEDWEEINL